MSSLADRNVVVTGGTGALGRAVTELLLEHGARCHIPVFDEAELAAFPFVDHDRIALTMNADLTNDKWVVDYYGSFESLWASIHIAGGFDMSPLLETSVQQLQAMLDLNLVSCFLSTREAARRMEGGGRIVNVAARPALEATGGMVAYSVSKAAVASLTRSSAKELADRDILVNAVAPSVIDTPANRKAMPDAPHATWPKPHELAETIVFLSSPRNTVTSGLVMPVYGRA